MSILTRHKKPGFEIIFKEILLQRAHCDDLISHPGFYDRSENQEKLMNLVETTSGSKAVRIN
jgi:hypothetical protein